MGDIKQVTIVLIEDNAGHARLIEKNLRRANVSNPIINLRDGQMALDYFFGEDGFVHKNPHPHLLVMLDLNLPEVDGYRVLEAMKGDQRTKSIPVIVLTTTDDVNEINRCYELGCNIYITKPVQYEDFSDAIAKLGLLLSVVALPDGG